jgi:pimeloyl-ACP methyl ester carboxylesterase
LPVLASVLASAVLGLGIGMTAAAGPIHRRGPRPLLLHLTLAMLRSSASVAASATSSSGSQSWNRHPEGMAEARALLERLAELGAGGFPEAVLREALAADRELIRGIAAYRRHPWHRDLPDPAMDDPPVIWSEGGSRLLDYGGSGPTALFVPSLVNRAYVLDLAPGLSMMRHLAARGLRPLLLDWGWPGEAERGFTLTDYIAGRLEGYCMGGNLALAAALRRPELVRALALLATPWDFHAAGAEQARALGQLLPLAEPMLAFSRTLPVDALQLLFAMLDPWGIGRKYRGFARLEPDGARARLFVALEDWLNDGVPLAAPVARECLSGWYGENTPARGAWRIAGLPVRPEALGCPAFVAVPSRDRIVPPESAAPLARLIPNAVLHRPAAGHIGMAAGGNAATSLWGPLADWVAAL